MQQPMIKRFRYRLAWLDWLNDTRWTEWREIEGEASYRLNGVPIPVLSAMSAGIILRDKHIEGTRYIPSHRITAVDWEET